LPFALKIKGICEVFYEKIIAAFTLLGSFGELRRAERLESGIYGFFGGLVLKERGFFSDIVCRFFKC